MIACLPPTKKLIAVADCAMRATADLAESRALS